MGFRTCVTRRNCAAVTTSGVFATLNMVRHETVFGRGS